MQNNLSSSKVFLETVPDWFCQKNHVVYNFIKFSQIQNQHKRHQTTISCMDYGFHFPPTIQLHLEASINPCMCHQWNSLHQSYSHAEPESESLGEWHWLYRKWSCVSLEISWEWVSSQVSWGCSYMKEREPGKGHVIPASFLINASRGCSSAMLHREFRSSFFSHGAARKNKLW